MPDESTLRKSYVVKCFYENINYIQKYLENTNTNYHFKIPS